MRLATVLGLGLSWCVITFATAAVKFVSVQNNGREVISIAGDRDGGFRRFDPAIAHCPADGGCGIVYVPAGTTLYRDPDGGGFIGVYR